MPFVQCRLLIQPVVQLFKEKYQTFMHATYVIVIVIALLNSEFIEVNFDLKKCLNSFHMLFQLHQKL